MPAGYVPAIGERDLDKIIRSIRNLYEVIGAGERMTQDESFYIDDASGNDANDGLTSTRPWKTGTHAYNFLRNNVNANGFVPTLNFLAGDQTPLSGANALTGPVRGAPYVILSGPAAGLATFDGGIAIYENTGSPIWIQTNIRVENASGGNGIEAGAGSSVRVVGDVEFGDITGVTGSGLYVTRGGYLIVEGLILVDGDMPFFSQSSHDGHLRYDATVLRYLQNCAFSQANIFSEGEGGDTVFTNGASFDTATHGATVTGKRYLVLNGASIQASGQTETFIPGSIAGTSHNGGVYYTDIDSPVGVQGLRFPATQSASSDANTLDDYEEGTWTPVLEGATTAGTQTYSVQVGSYTKIGRMVFVTANIELSALDGATAGNIRIGGLPFAAANVGSLLSAAAIGPYSNWNLNTAGGYSQLTGSVNANATNLTIFECGDNVARAAIQAAAVGNTTTLRLTASYRV